MSPANAVNIFEKPPSGALIRAVVDRDIEAVRDLLVRGVNINAENDWGTALIWASCGRPEIALLLIEKGANINAKSEREGITALMCAAGSGHPEVVRALIDKGAHLEEKNKRGTALDRAEKGGYPEIVRILKGAIERPAREAEEKRQHAAAEAKQQYLKGRAPKIKIKGEPTP